MIGNAASPKKEEAPDIIVSKPRAPVRQAPPPSSAPKATLAAAAIVTPVAAGKYWTLQEAFCKPDCEYKNYVIVALQKKLLAREPTLPSDALRKFSAQMYQENGDLNIWSVLGDHGHAVGIGQWNVGNAASWLAANCAKNAQGKCDYDLELERQLNVLADDMIGAWKQYKGDIRLAVIDHNRPASASRGVDQCLAGPTVYDDPGIKDCYYGEQVMQHYAKFTLS